MSRGLGSRGRSANQKVDEVITKTLETAPKDATHRSTRSMAAEVGLTQSAVHRIYRAWMRTWNDDPKPYVWTKTADQILNPSRVLHTN